MDNPTTWWLFSDSASRLHIQKHCTASRSARGFHPRYPSWISSVMPCRFTHTKYSVNTTYFTIVGKQINYQPSLSPFLRIFPGEPGLAGSVGAKDNEHFTGWMPFLSANQQCHPCHRPPQPVFLQIIRPGPNQASTEPFGITGRMPFPESKVLLEME